MPICVMFLPESEPTNDDLEDRVVVVLCSCCRRTRLGSLLMLLAASDAGQRASACWQRNSCCPPTIAARFAFARRCLPSKTLTRHATLPGALQRIGACDRLRSCRSRTDCVNSGPHNVSRRRKRAALTNFGALTRARASRAPNPHRPARAATNRATGDPPARQFSPIARQRQICSARASVAVHIA